VAWRGGEEQLRGKMDWRRRSHGTAVELGGPAWRGGVGPGSCIQKEVKERWAWPIRPVCLSEICPDKPCLSAACRF
jgi:hypothetical protein